jgi:hypothetical protein
VPRIDGSTWLEGTHIPGTGMSRWRVAVAEIVRPPPPEPENAKVVLEYRAMHEEIQRRWREESREGLQYLGVFTLGQLALWVVGGVVARGWVGAGGGGADEQPRRGGQASA